MIKRTFFWLIKIILVVIAIIAFYIAEDRFVTLPYYQQAFEENPYAGKVIKMSESNFLHSIGSRARPQEGIQISYIGPKVIPQPKDNYSHVRAHYGYALGVNSALLRLKEPDGTLHLYDKKEVKHLRYPEICSLKISYNGHLLSFSELLTHDLHSYIVKLYPHKSDKRQHKYKIEHNASNYLELTSQGSLTSPGSLEIQMKITDSDYEKSFIFEMPPHKSDSRRCCAILGTWLLEQTIG